MLSLVVFLLILSLGWVSWLPFICSQTIVICSETGLTILPSALSHFTIAIIDCIWISCIWFSPPSSIGSSCHGPLRRRWRRLLHPLGVRGIVRGILLLETDFYAAGPVSPQRGHLDQGRALQMKSYYFIIINMIRNWFKRSEKKQWRAEGIEEVGPTAYIGVESEVAWFLRSGGLRKKRKMILPIGHTLRGHLQMTSSERRREGLLKIWRSEGGCVNLVL